MSPPFMITYLLKLARQIVCRFLAKAPAIFPRQSELACQIVNRHDDRHYQKTDAQA